MFNYETFDRCLERTYSIENSKFIDAKVGDKLAGYTVFQFVTGTRDESFVVLGATVSSTEDSDRWFEWAVFSVTAGVKHTSLMQVTKFREIGFVAGTRLGTAIQNTSQLVALDRPTLHSRNNNCKEW